VLGGREAAVDERFLQIQMAFVVERLRENFEEAPKQAGADPVLKSPVAGLIRRIAVREVRPRGPVLRSHYAVTRYYPVDSLQPRIITAVSSDRRVIDSRYARRPV